MYKIKRTEKEIDDLLNEAWEGRDKGSKYRGVTYEEGIINFWEWLTEEEPESTPME